MYIICVILWVMTTHVTLFADLNKYIKQGLEADGLEEMYKKVHAAICPDPTAMKSEMLRGRLWMRLCIHNRKIMCWKLCIVSYFSLNGLYIPWFCQFNIVSCVCVCCAYSTSRNLHMRLSWLHVCSLSSLQLMQMKTRRRMSKDICLQMGAQLLPNQKLFFFELKHAKNLFTFCCLCMLFL